VFRVRLRRMTSRNTRQVIHIGKNVRRSCARVQARAYTTGEKDGTRLAGLDSAGFHALPRFSRQGYARATRGVPVPVCNPDIFFCIFYFLYGLVSMTRHTAPAYFVSMTPSVELRGYIPAGTRPSLHTNVYSVKYFLFLLTISVIYPNIVTWAVSYTVYSHKSVQLRL
jgi:hypothetical protein